MILPIYCYHSLLFSRTTYLLQVLTRRLDHLKKWAVGESGIALRSLVKEPACHSEDERDPDGGMDAFFICDKPGRSATATSFLRLIDHDQATAPTIQARKKGKPPKKVRRQIPPPPRVQPCSKLWDYPSRPALDWFDPDYFNALCIEDRAPFKVDPVIALPAEIRDLAGYKEWSKLSRAEFMKRYGDQVKAKYNLPTDDEIATLQTGRDMEEVQQ